MHSGMGGMPGGMFGGMGKLLLTARACPSMQHASSMQGSSLPRHLSIFVMSCTMKASWGCCMHLSGPRLRCVCSGRDLARQYASHSCVITITGSLCHKLSKPAAGCQESRLSSASSRSACSGGAGCWVTAAHMAANHCQIAWATCCRGHARHEWEGRGPTSGRCHRARAALLPGGALQGHVEAHEDLTQRHGRQRALGARQRDADRRCEAGLEKGHQGDLPQEG